MVKRLWTVIIENWIGTGATVLVGVAVGWLRKNGSPYADPAAYGVVCAALVLLVFIALKIYRSLPKPVAGRIPDEETIRVWIDSNRMSNKKVDSLEMEFAREFVTTAGRPLAVGLPKGSRTLIIHSNLEISGDLLARLHSRSTAEQHQVSRELRMEMARCKMGFKDITVPLSKFVLAKTISLTEGLTEHAFLEAVGEVELAQILAIEVLQMRVPT